MRPNQALRADGARLGEATLMATMGLADCLVRAPRVYAEALVRIKENPAGFDHRHPALAIADQIVLERQAGGIP